LVCNAKEKTYEVKWKDGMIRWAKAMHSPSNVHNVLGTHNVN